MAVVGRDAIDDDEGIFLRLLELNSEREQAMLGTEHSIKGVVAHAAYLLCAYKSKLVRESLHHRR